MWRPSLLAAGWLALCALVGDVMGEEKRDLRSIPLRTHTLSTPYVDSNMHNRWWEYGGDTLIRTDQYVRLTSDRPSRNGWLFSRVPLTATNWQIDVEFKIHGNGNLHGDGMAMWITKQRAEQGVVFGSTDKFDGLGIFIDTYKNNRPGTVFPYVMAMVGNGQTAYDKDNDGKANEYAGCSARGIRGANIPTRLRLTYFQDKSLKLELQYKVANEWEVCFERDDPPTLPGVSYLGFSAETGELSDNHDIIQVQTKNMYHTITQVDNSASGSGGRNRHREPKGGMPAKKGSWFWFLVKTVFVLGLLAGVGYVGFTMWRAQSKRSHRF